MSLIASSKKLRSNTTVENTNIKEFQLTLPYAGKKGESIAGGVVKRSKKIEKDKVKARISYKAKTLDFVL